MLGVVLLLGSLLGYKCNKWLRCPRVGYIGNVVGRTGFVGGIVSRVGFVVGEIEIGVLMVVVLVLVKLFLRR